MRPLRLVAALAVFLLLAAVLAALFLDVVARRAIEKSATFALGVETELEEADLSLFAGGLTVGGARVANPEGFEEETFLSVGKGALEVSLRSLADERVVAPLLVLEDVELVVERGPGGTNYGAILENLERFESGADAPEPDAKTYLVQRIEIRDVEALFDLLPAGGEATEVRLHVPSIELDDFGSEGLTLAEIASLVVRAVLSASIEAGGVELPTDLLEDLRGRLAELGELPLELEDAVLREVEGVLERAGGALEYIRRPGGSGEEQREH